MKLIHRKGFDSLIGGRKPFYNIIKKKKKSHWKLHSANH